MTRVRLAVHIVSSVVFVLAVSLSVYMVRGSAANRKVPGTGTTESGGIAGPDSTVSVRVSVLNGCGRPGVASPFVRKLRDGGFDVVNGMGGNADSFDYDTSVVIDRCGNRAKAERVARVLGIHRILSQRSENPYLMEEIAVIIGRDWDRLLFPAGEKTE